MVIREMSMEECYRLLAGARFARLGCAHDNQPYVVPVYIAYDETSGCLYGFTTPGQKIEWMRANPRVCVEVDEVTANDRWVSVIVIGRFEELPQDSSSARGHPRSLERPQHSSEAIPQRPVDDNRFSFDDERDRAWQVLKNHAEWWEPGCTVWTDRVHRTPAETFIPVFYKVRIDHVTGHEATRKTK